MIEIDLTGPDGNAFNLISTGLDLARQINKNRGNEYLNVEAIQQEMMSSDYEHLIKVFDKYFGHIVILYR